MKKKRQVTDQDMSDYNIKSIPIEAAMVTPVCIRILFITFFCNHPLET